MDMYRSFVTSTDRRRDIWYIAALQFGFAYGEAGEDHFGVASCLLTRMIRPQAKSGCCCQRARPVLPVSLIACLVSSVAIWLDMGDE